MGRSRKKQTESRDSKDGTIKEKQPEKRAVNTQIEQPTERSEAVTKEVKSRRQKTVQKETLSEKKTAVSDMGKPDKQAADRPPRVTNPTAPKSDQSQEHSSEPHKNLKSRRQGSGGGGPITDQEMRRYIALLIIPVLAIILIVVVLVSGNLRKEPEVIVSTTKETGSQDVPPSIPVIEPDTKEYIMDFGGSILEQDAVPEINQLMEQYFLSISDCDMDTFLHLFTSRDTSEEAQFRDTFEKQREYIESYQNISCYTVKGLEEDDYVVYVYYDVKFVGVETLGPDLVRIYAVKDEDGQYRIFDQEMSPELESYLDAVSMNEDVRLLISQVDNQIVDAMNSDEELCKRIAYLKNGPDYMQGEEEQAGEEPAGEAPTAGE